jgi:hypothetical protein
VGLRGELSLMSEVPLSLRIGRIHRTPPLALFLAVVGRGWARLGIDGPALRQIGPPRDRWARLRIRRPASGRMRAYVGG